MNRSLGVKYVQQYKTLHICDNPAEYFKTQKLKQLIIRDAGIGDLLLLEPVLRQLVKDNKREINVLSRYPEVYYYNPYIFNNYRQTQKEVIPKNISLENFDAWEDLRGYSETCQNREKLCRTDCYNQIFNVNLDDAEPRIYISNKDKPILKKKKGFTYIGLVCDGSHNYRRYDRGTELIRFILATDPKYVVVLIGDQRFVKCSKNSRVLDFQTKTSVRDCVNLVKDLDYMVSVDTGILHVALAMHVPTVCIFSIIKPQLRLHYYTGPRQVIYRGDLGCVGCGSYHMAICRHGNKDKNPHFIAPCLDIPPEDIMDRIRQLKKTSKRRTFKGERDKSETIPQINNIKPTNQALKLPNRSLPNRMRNNKLTMPIIVLNEEKNLPRFIELVMKNPSVGKVIAIDGGSTDRTVELLKKAGAEVYVHQYDKNYHDMQAMQRNYSCSFVADGEKIFIMDVDECFSNELAGYLDELANSRIEYGVVSRRTFNYYSDIGDREKQIKDYPDYQPRFFTWNRRFKWVGSPHHKVYNVPEPVRIDRDIIHYEKEGKDRRALEKQWAAMQAKSRRVYR
jgi:ADP-heptose:LPS heptosyltransferase